ncbi:UDP-galactose transporter [Diplonema papillatum]|nr:UDP-galactose transporter [Diplonema papillatum]
MAGVPRTYEQLNEAALETLKLPENSGSAPVDEQAPTTPTKSEGGSSSPKGKKYGGSTGLKFGPLGWLSLGCLVIQNSALTLTMRASRLSGGSTGPMYLATSAVVVCELIKLVLSFIMLFLEKGSWSGMAGAINTDILTTPSQNFYLLIPSALYTIQNNLQYFAASNLDPASFQVLYQMKLVTTALLSVVMLKRSLSPTQWFSVFILTAGIAMVQTSEAPVTTAAKQIKNSDENHLLGFIAVLAACCTSAGAGVYLEKLVKQTKPSVWIRNIQLAVFGLIVGCLGCFMKDREAVAKGGFLQGFSPIVWAVVLLQSLGGILIAVVVKYADNIIKGFATGLSIICSCLASVFLFNFAVTPQYLAGASTVIVSAYMYGVNVPCSSYFESASSWLLGLRAGMDQQELEDVYVEKEVNTPRR